MSRTTTRTTQVPPVTPISALLGNALLSLAEACRDIRATARAG